MLASGCAIAEQDAPPLAGPSELGLAVTIAASPDALEQDGISQAHVTVMARDASGRPARGVRFAIDTEVGGSPSDVGRLQTRSVTTDREGRATVIYTAPPRPRRTVDADTTVSVVFLQIGTDASAAVRRVVTIRLLRPGLR